MARAMETTVTIDVSADDDLSAQAIDLGEWLLAGIICPATLTSTSMTFTGASTEEGTYRSLVDSNGTAISVTVAADSHILIEPQTFAGVRWLKLVTGSSEAADREFTVVLHRREG